MTDSERKALASQHNEDDCGAAACMIAEFIDVSISLSGIDSRDDEQTSHISTDEVVRSLVSGDVLGSPGIYCPARHSTRLLGG